MGFSVSGAVAVVFLGLLVSASTLYPTVDRYTEHRSDAVSGRNERALTRQNTAIGAVNATYNASDDTLTVTVENRGASTLALSKVDFLVDGTYATATTNTNVDGDRTTGVWAPGETLTLTRTESSAPTRIKVVTGKGVAVTAVVEVV